MGIALLYQISDGIDGVKETLYHMARMVKDARRNPNVVQFARSLIAGVPEKAWREEVNAVFNWVRDNIRYTLDPDGVEMLTTPMRLIEEGCEDCDGKSTLLASLLASIGYKVRFRAVGFQNGDLSHVYVEVLLGTIWVPLDSTEPHEMGWRPPGEQNHFIVNV